MTERIVNLRDLLFVVADPSPYLGMLIHSMLRGFGANKIIEVRDSFSVLQTLTAHRADVLICDGGLPPQGGFSLTRTIRRHQTNQNRIIPILLMTSDTREATIKAARDAGANMVVAKPLSPASLYDRLAWVAFNPRKFVDTDSYFGPDRRFKNEGYALGPGRRKGDVMMEGSPAMANNTPGAGRNS